jgi:hypothetical protein
MPTIKSKGPPVSALGRCLTRWFADVICRRGVLAAFVLPVVAVVAACSTQPTAPAASVNTTPGPRFSAAPTLAPSPAPTSAPFPEASPVAEAAGSETLASGHWVGYTFPTGGVTGVRAQWSEPTVTGHTGAEEFVWVGIGGWDETVQNIIQVGSFAYFPGGGQMNQGIWYQLVPSLQHPQFPLIGVGPGDEIAASVVQLKAREDWQMSLTDMSSGQSFTKTVKFRSLGAYPSFVVEDPNSGPLGPSGPFYPFPSWGTVTFSNTQVRIASRWKPAASIYGYRINMVRNGQALAVAGPLDTRSGFSAKQK